MDYRSKELTVRRTAAKVDSNQSDIVKALRKIPGVSVMTGMDDLLVGFKKKTFWFELKSESAVSKKTGKILESRKRESQKKIDQKWTGHHAYCVTLDDVLKEIGLWI